MSEQATRQRSADPQSREARLGRLASYLQAHGPTAVHALPPELADPVVLAWGLREGAIEVGRKSYTTFLAEKPEKRLNYNTGEKEWQRKYRVTVDSSWDWTRLDKSWQKPLPELLAEDRGTLEHGLEAPPEVRLHVRLTSTGAALAG